MSQCCSFACGVCKILCYTLCCKCCKKEQIVKEEFSLLALGLGGAGKSTLLSTVCGEIEEEIVPTKGFSIKDISLARAKLHVKEVGGSESIRRYWHHYFSGVEGLIFVVDGSTNDDEVALARSELEKVLSHRDMTDVPLLVLVSKIDSSDSSSLQKFSEQLDIPKLCASRSFLIDAYSLKDVGHLKMLLEKFVDVMKRPDNLSGDNEEIDQEVTGRI
ncbi:ADP-ribosylation factor-like protein 15 isoform X2 [Rhopilema esculentum]|uniref:ADP-ribosylation factor-like protein 15 isoform X2 n=1 Tax=Rhopilema esculentum TaxID=499914 RepID=UPI0031CDD580